MKSNLTWTQTKCFFDPDGGLRDICVLGIAVDDWQAVLQTVVSSYQTQFVLGEVQISLLPTAREIFGIHLDDYKLLKVFVAEMTVNCHFFSDNEIDFDLDPREVTTAAHFFAVLDFMRLIGETCQKKVHLSHEADWHNPVFHYDSQLKEFSLGEF
jgi:hypothetical protein